MDAAGDLHRQCGTADDANGVVRLRRAEVRLHVQRDHGLAFSVADAVLDDAGDLPAARRAGTRSRPRVSAIFGWISSVTLSSFQPSASAIIAIDSASPTCRTLPSFTLRQELLHASDRRRFSAGTADGGCARPARDRLRSPSRARRRAVSAIGSASITNPGFTPVPSTATRARLASASIFLAAAALLLTGIGQFLGRRDDRHLQLEHRLELGHDLLQRRLRAEHGDVRAGRP